MSSKRQRERERRREKARERGGQVARCPDCPLQESLIDNLTPRELGDMGEEIAVCYLRERGYEIVERNYRCAEGEADIIAFDMDAEEVVLVEVKTRRTRHIADAPFPEEAVDERKRRRYRRIASCFAMAHFPIPALRFDVIAVTLAPGHEAAVEHLFGAFDWDAGQ